MNGMKEKALALLREQQCKGLEEKAKLLVIRKLVESEGAFDLVGAVIDEVCFDNGFRANHLLSEAIIPQIL